MKALLKRSTLNEDSKIHNYTGGGCQMFKTLKKRVKNEKGLTLIELLAVVVILAIIAAIAIPAIGNIIENNRAKALVSDAINVMNAANIYFTENSDQETVTAKDLKDKKYLESVGKLDATKTTVTHVTSGANTITASGTNGNVSLDITGYTLQQLTDAKVSVDDNGKVQLDTGNSTTSN